MSGAEGKRKAGQPRGKTQMEDLMGLPAGYRLLRYRKDGEHDTAHVGREEVPEGQRTCPRCGAREQGSGKAWRKVWHMPLRGVPLMLIERRCVVSTPASPSDMVTAEGINNTIKVVKRVSYGFKDFRRMRRRCLLACGFYKIVKRETRLGDVGPDGNLS